MKKYIQMVFGDESSKVVKKYRKVVEKISSREADISAMSQDKMREIVGIYKDELKQITDVKKQIEVLQHQLYQENLKREKEIVQFCYFMAEKIVYRELKRDPSFVIDAIKTIATHKEEVTVKISNEDYLFIQPHLEKLAGEMNISKIRFEKDATFSAGDVIVESEQGLVDGTLETRLKKMKFLLDGQE